MDTLSLEAASEFVDFHLHELRAAGAIDPWAKDCFIVFVDLVTNYERVVRPMPSPENEPPLRASTRLVARGEDEGWLEPYFDSSARDRALDLEQVASEFRRFDGLFLDPRLPGQVRTWANSLRDIDPLVRAYDGLDDGVLSIAGGMWPEFDELARRTKIDRYALFDLFILFARTYQYDLLLAGGAEYVPHPFRRSAYQSSITDLPGDGGTRWSWGRYFVWLMEQRDWPFSSVMTHIDMVRDEAFRQKATWNDLWTPRPNAHRREEQVEKLTTIAAKLRLPAKLSAETNALVKEVSEWAGPVKSLIGTAAEVSVLTVRAAGKLVVHEYGDSIPTEVDFIRRRLEWPGLLAEVKDR